jgi:citrate synthase
MMFSVPAEPYDVDPVVAEALRVLLILHADHGQNCSASAVRLVGSGEANIFSSVAAGIHALSGPLHGGANQAVLEMLQGIVDDGGDVDRYIAKAKDKEDPFRLMGFGHRVYKNFDPRAKIIKKMADESWTKLGVNDPLLEVAMHLEEVALRRRLLRRAQAVPERRLLLRNHLPGDGLPTDMFTVLFALGRLPGWISQWREMSLNPSTRIFRPLQVYTGVKIRDYTPIGER